MSAQHGRVSERGCTPWSVAARLNLPSSRGMDVLLTWECPLDLAVAAYWDRRPAGRPVESQACHLLAPDVAVQPRTGAGRCGEAVSRARVGRLSASAKAAS